MPSCVVSDRHRFIWIHLAKNASSTLAAEFTRDCRGGGLLQYAQLDAGTRAGYFTFVILREPVSRLLSAYQEISMRWEDGARRHPPKPFLALDEGAARFETFLDDLGDRRWDSHVRDQAAYLEDIRVDAFGSVESLPEDLARIYSLLRMGEVPPLPHARSRIDRRDRHGYGRHYLAPADLSEGQRRRIEGIYAADVDLYRRHVLSRRLSDSQKSRDQIEAEIALLRRQAATLEGLFGIVHGRMNRG